MSSVLVIGSCGMAGHLISDYLSKKDHTVTTIARENADIIYDVEKSTPLTTSLLDNYDFVVNCIGLLVNDSIARPDRAALINAWFPHHLAQLVKESNTKLIHLSTDCIFDGKLGNYKEKDIHTETNAYGRSKSFGEVNNSKDITFRMSIIGPEIKENGTGLFHWLVNNTSTTVNGWTNAWWNGMTTLQLAKCINHYISNPETTGVYHLVNNSNAINKYDLLVKINEIFNLNKEIVPMMGPKEVNKLLIDTRQTFGCNIPDYDIQLSELKQYLNTY